SASTKPRRSQLPDLVELAGKEQAALGLAHPFADVRDRAPRKPPQLRGRCLGLAVPVSSLKLCQPDAQLRPLLGWEVGDSLLDVFEGHLPEGLLFISDGRESRLHRVPCLRQKGSAQPRQRALTIAVTLASCAKSDLGLLDHLSGRLRATGSSTDR